MFCDKCGAQLVDTANFCNKCGNVIKKQNIEEKKQLQEVNTEQVTSEKKGGLWKKVIPAIGGIGIIVLCVIIWMSGTANKSDLEYSYNESNKTATVIGLKDEMLEEEELVISIPAEVTKGLIKYKVTTIGKDAFYHCDNLTSVTIPDSVTTIKSGAFWCSGLTSITIPNSVTTIEQAAFANCYGLTSVTIPGSVRSIGRTAFYYCDNLTSVTILDGVTSIGDYAFWECHKLTSVRLPNTLKKAGSALFADCPSLLGVVMPDNVEFETNEEEYKSLKFDNYEKLKEWILWGKR